jgi:hypothetical protein
MITDADGSGMRFAVDGWDPSYGTSLEVEGGAEAASQVIADVECDPARWAPVRPTSVALPASTIFVDGVRRLDARVWIDEPARIDAAGVGRPESPATEASAALCASYAAGSVCCCTQGAHVLDVAVRRGLFTAASHAEDLTTWAGTFEVFPTVIKPDQGLAVSLSASLQRQLNTLEIVAAVTARRLLPGHGIPDLGELMIVDGRIQGRENLPRVLGFIKSHQIAYLEPRLHAMVGTMAAGERTPVFLLGTSWDRFSWYLRLPCLPGQPWAGIARVECAANLPEHEAIALADLSQAVLPRFASAEYKDARAPQNLYPVAGLERELRRRLGDSALLYRALRRAAFGS